MRISDWSSDVCSSELVHAWLKPLQATWRDDATVLYAPNTFIRDEVRSRYLGRIRELLGHFAGTPEVTLEIGSLPRAVAERTAPALPARTTADAVAFTGNLDSHYTFDNFVEGRSNQLGRAAASHAAQNPGDRAHTPRPLLRIGKAA